MRSRGGRRRRLLFESLCQRRVLAAITGMVFDDVSDTWRLEADESALEGRLVFVDLNDNGLPDDGEPYALTDADGRFSFDGMEDGDQVVRLFAAAPSQQQHFALRPEVATETVDLQQLDPDASAGPLTSLADPASPLLALQAGLASIDLDQSQASELSLPTRPTAVLDLGDGRALVLAAGDLQDHAYLVDGDGQVQAVDLFADGVLPDSFAGWSAGVVDADGHGLLLASDDEGTETPLYRLVPGDAFRAESTTVELAAGSALVGDGGVTSVVAQPVDDGLSLALWSNVTGEAIADPVVVPGAEKIVAYSDSRGLLYVQMQPGPNGAPETGGGRLRTLQVLDVEADFVPLQTIQGLSPLLAVDTHRSVVFDLDADESRLRASDALEGETIADWLLELPPATPADLLAKTEQLAFRAGSDELILLAPGVAIGRISLRNVDGHRLRSETLQSPYPLRFATRVEGDNQPPVLAQSSPEFTVVQEQTLSVAEGGLLAGAIDAEDDPFVVVRSSSPQHGQVEITPLGAMTYVPEPGFVGTDSFTVFLHDGRGPSEPFSVQINVIPPVEDLPPEISYEPSPLPLPIEPPAGTVVGEVTSVQLDGPLMFELDDPRFGIVNPWVFVAPGAQFDYQLEPQIDVTVTATGPGEIEPPSVSATFTVEVSDSEASILDIQPRQADVPANSLGASVAELIVSHNISNPLVLEVDDARFEIVDDQLLLKPDVALDGPDGSQLLVHVQATDPQSGASMLVPFEVQVVDESEPETWIALSSQSLREYDRGATVGSVMVSGPQANEHIISVDDSRFEIVGDQLKLRDGMFLTRDQQLVAVVTITAQPVGQPAASTSATFEIDVLANENPYHNTDNPLDVNDDGQVTPLDALLILDAISQNRGAGPIEEFPLPGAYWDVNGDGWVTPIDALLILNHINQTSRPPIVAEPESSSNSQSDDETPSEDSSLDPLLPESTIPAEGEQADGQPSSAPLLAPLQSMPQDVTAAAAVRLVDRILSRLDVVADQGTHLAEVIDLIQRRLERLDEHSEPLQQAVRDLVDRQVFHELAGELAQRIEQGRDSQDAWTHAFNAPAERWAGWLGRLPRETLGKRN